MGELGREEQALIAKMQAEGFRSASQIPIEVSRQGLTQMALSMAGPKVVVQTVHDSDIPGPAGPLRIRLYDPDPLAGPDRGVVLFFHGGGFYLGNLETHDHVCRHLAAHAGVPVVALEYRLAPEHKFPAALDDCFAALQWVAGPAAAARWDPRRIALVGDSAGGALAVAVCLLTRDRRGPPVAFHAAIYPALTVEDGEDFPSRRALGSGEYFIAFEDWKFFRSVYLSDPEREASLPLVSPIRAKDFRGLPAALIVAAEYDPCRDENRRYAELLAGAGIAAEYVCFEGTIHPFYLFDGVLPLGRKAQQLVADRVRKALAAP